MSDPEATQPPVRQPNTLKTWVPRIMEWYWSHKDYTIPATMLLVGYLLGKAL